MSSANKAIEVNPECAAFIVRVEEKQKVRYIRVINKINSLPP